MILGNGYETIHIAVNDRGFQYGDGLFETIEVLNGQAIFLKQHLARLVLGCYWLKLPPPDMVLLTDKISNVCKQEKSAILKVIVTRGVGGRGYRLPDPIETTQVISLYPASKYPHTHYTQGINARLCQTRLGLNPNLAGIKHLNRLENVMARSEWDYTEIQEGIMLDINDRIIEGTMSNLFYVKNGTVYTSLLEYSGVRGIIREVIIELLHLNKVSIIEHFFDKLTLFDADEIFVCNSIIGIWPVKQIESFEFKVGAVTKQLQAWLDDLKSMHFINAT